MTRIRATCPDCGEIDLRPVDIDLEVVRSGADEVADGSSYTFSCPDCTQVVVKPADERIASLLRSGGVQVTVREIPTLPPHPEGPSGGPVFTRDDLLDLHLLLEQEDWFEELARSLSTSDR